MNESICPYTALQDMNEWEAWNWAKFILDGLHCDLDGWSEEEKKVIREFLEDTIRGARNFPMRSDR